jgi:hypothetical protein
VSGEEYGSTARQKRFQPTGHWEQQEDFLFAKPFYQNASTRIFVLSKKIIITQKSSPHPLELII